MDLMKHNWIGMFFSCLLVTQKTLKMVPNADLLGIQHGFYLKIGTWPKDSQVWQGHQRRTADTYENNAEKHFCVHVYMFCLQPDPLDNCSFKL